MRRYVTVGFFFLFSIVFLQQVTSQVVDDYPIRQVAVDSEIHFRPSTNEIDNTYIPYKNRGNIQVRSMEQFKVTYNAAVPEAARNAFENGVLAIAGDLFKSTVPVNITLEYKPIDGNALAGASTGGFFVNPTNAPKINGIYPVALAEKFIGQELNESNEADVRIEVNSNIDWFYKVEDAVGIGARYDFISILLHEVLHGLGFTAAVAVQNGVGFIGLFSNDRFSAFVDFLINDAGRKLTTFDDGTANMASRLSRNDLFWESVSQNTRYKLYTPTPYEPGSSVSHLDLTTYNGTENGLMTPSASRGQAIRDPGISAEILYDLGWKHTFLYHNPPDGSVERAPDSDVTVVVDVESDAGLDTSTLFMTYIVPTMDTAANEFKVPLTHISGTRFEAVIPGPGEEVPVFYYFEASDIDNRFVTQPGYDVFNDVQVVFSINYGFDTTPPVIMHDNINLINEKDRTIDLEATVTDEFTGIESVIVEWRLNGVEMSPVMMEIDSTDQFGDNSYIASLPIPDGVIIEGDSIEYRIVATDRAIAANTTIIPEDRAYFKVNVTSVPLPVVHYFNDFNTESDDFEGNGFTITQPSQFQNPAIHSRHPYLSAGDGNTFNLIFNLKVPIIVDDRNPVVEFDEIVLVEPGEPGFAFGTLEFWDYVIVEARKVGTNNWFNIIDGYDSRVHPIWVNTYNSSFVAGNSTATGNPSLFRNRSINITSKGHFAAGDTIFLRFRLFSDPFAYGWGWAIDNLNIQDQTSSVLDVGLKDDLQIFPNPVTGDFVHVRRPHTGEREATVLLYTMEGQLVSRHKVIDYEFSIPLPESSSMYILTLISGINTVSRMIVRTRR